MEGTQNTVSDSILDSVKKLVMVDLSYTAFDDVLILHINTVFANLVQMGIGPIEGFAITGASEQWSSFTENNKMLNPVKTYVGLKVKTYFDPPQNTAHIEAINKQLNELEVRMYTVMGQY